VIEEISVVIQRMNEQLAELDRGGPPERYLKQAPFQGLRRPEFGNLRRGDPVARAARCLRVAPPGTAPRD
jgi:hypothetical protein